MQNTCTNKNKTSLSDAIQRGRIALSQAEDHIQVFEQFLNQSNSCQENTNNLVASLKSVATPDDYDGLQHMNDQTDGGDDDNLFQLPESVGFLDRLMRVRKDEIRKTLANISSENTQFTHNCSMKHNFESQNIKKKKKRISFDPTRLYKVSQQRDSQNHVQDKDQEFTQFKALPLPGGANVANDPYALTKAAKSKISKKQSDDISHHHSNRFDASLLLDRDCGRSDSAFSTSDRKDRSSKRKKEIDEIYKAATEHVKTAFINDNDESDTDEDEHLSLENIETVKGLQMEIARLKAQLRCKKMKCLETIKELEEEVKCPNVDEILGVSVVCDKSSKIGTMQEGKQKNDNQYGSLYERQQEWNKSRMDKVQSVRETVERNTLESIKCCPQILHGTKSWLDAKHAHDKLMREANEREMQLQAEREEKERIKQKRQVEESENMLRLAKEKARSLKQNVDKHHQLEYIDRLSRSTRREKKVPDVTHSGKDKEELLSASEVGQEDHVRREKEIISPFLLDTIKANEKPKSFADMDDQEFAKMIKDIQFQAKKKFRQEAKSHKKQIGTDVDRKTLERKVNLSPYR